MTKTNWNNEPLNVWSVVYYKEDDKGNQKFYDYIGDCSFLCEGISKNELRPMTKKEVKLKGII